MHFYAKFLIKFLRTSELSYVCRGTVLFIKRALFSVYSVMSKGYTEKKMKDVDSKLDYASFYVASLLR